MGQINARPLTGADLTDLTVGTPILVPGSMVLAPHEHTPAEIIEIRRKPVKGRTATGRSNEDVGHQYTLRYRTRYGTESERRMFDSEAALLAEYPPFTTDPMTRHLDEDREKYLDREATRPLRLPEESGDTVTVIEDWGSRVTASIFIPGVDADEALTKIQQAVLAAYPDARMPKAQAAPVADIRVDVYDTSGERDVPVAVNVLDAESGYYTQGRMHFTRRVPEDRVTGS